MRRGALSGLGMLASAFVTHASSVELTPSQVFQLDSPSIVVVQAHDTSGTMTELGSGVVIGKGVVVSNCHVFTKADTATILYGQKSLPAELLHGDVNHDLCSFTVKGLNAPPVQMGSTANLKVGQQAFAIGAPEGLQLTLSGGLISSLRKIPGGVVLQVTTPISPGSSGGGLFDSQGRLIGITSYYMGQGQQLNFAVPVEWIRDLPQHGLVAQSPTTQSQATTRAAPSKEALDADIERGYQAVQQGKYADALAIFVPLAKRGDAMAQYELGFMVESGQGVRQDYAEAAKWYQLSAQQGNVGAQTNLSVLYVAGRGVAQDYAQAVKLLRLAAEQRFPEALNDLGSMYQFGGGVTRNLVAAYALFNLGGAENITGSQSTIAAHRDKLAASMSFAQVEAGQDLTRQMRRDGVLKALDAYLNAAKL